MAAPDGDASESGEGDKPSDAELVASLEVAGDGPGG